MKSPLIFTGIIDAMFKRIKPFVLILFVSLSALLLAASGAGRNLDRLVYDDALTRPGQSLPPEDIIIVALDENTIDVMADEMDGLFWPYPRAFHARVLDNLARAGAKAVFMDIILDMASGFGPEDDKILMTSLSGIPVVLAGEFNEMSRINPHPAFIEAGARAGNISIPIDADHRVRHMRGAIGFPRTFKDALHYFSGNFIKKDPVIQGALSDIPSVQEVMVSIVDQPDQLLNPGFIQFFGPSGSFQTISYYEVFHEALFEPHKDKIRNTVIFLGRTITASITPDQQPDVFPVPYAEKMMAGVEILANAYATLASGKTRHLVPPLIMVLLIFIWFFITILVFSRLKHPLAGFGVFLLSLVIIRGGYHLLYINHAVLMVSPFVFFSSVFYIFTVGRHYIQERDKRLYTQTQLFNYLPGRVAEFVLKNPQKLAMAGDKTRITLLFADLAGFTTLSEKYSPEIIIPMLQEHLRDMTQIIFQYQGTLDKYLGDGIMAFWGAPEPQENHADLALGASLAMLNALDQANIHRRETGFDALHLRIGLHTGEAVVGNIGSDLFLDYTAIGDNVNTASRIEGAGKFFDTRITISRDCIAALSAGLPDGLFRLGTVSVKGRSVPVRLYTIADPAKVDAYREFAGYLEILDQGDYEKARETLKKILEKNPGFGPAMFHDSKFNSDQQPLLDENHQPYWRLDSK